MSTRFQAYAIAPRRRTLRSRALMTTACRSCGVEAGVPCRFRGSGRPLPDGVHWWRWTAYLASIETKEAA